MLAGSRWSDRGAWTARVPLGALVPLVASVLAACGAAPPPPAADDVVVVPAPQVADPRSAVGRASPPAAVDPDAGEWPHEVALPASPACVFARSAFSGDVRTAPDAEPFAYLRSTAAADVHLAQGVPLTHATVVAQLGDLSMRAVVVEDDLGLHPARPMRLGDLLHLKPTAELRVTSARVRRLVVELKDDLSFLTDVAAPLSAAIGCDGLRFDAASFDPWSNVGKPTAHAVLRGPRVPLAATRGGGPVASAIVSAGEEPEVAVVGRSGGQARIVWDRPDALLVAWVPGTALVPPPPRIPGGGGTGTGLIGIGRGGGSRLPTFTCDGPLAVGVLQRGEISRIGTLSPRTRFDVAQGEGPHTVLRLSHPALSLRSDVRLVARTSDLSRCEETAR